MTVTRESEALVRFMAEEVDLLGRIAELEVRLKSCVLERNWKGLETALRRMNPIAQKLAQVEEERNLSFRKLQASLGLGEEAGLYHVVVLLPYDHRERLAEAYRRLKLSVIAIQGITGNIDAYLRNVTGEMQAVLSELYPFRKGKIYSRRGKSKPVESTPMVISQRL